MSAADSVFLQVFRNAGGGKRIAVLISAFFDESSEANAKTGILAVCGYALDEAGLKRFVPAWRRMLHRYRLPYFHMNQCNAQKGVFSHLSETDCDKCARKAIKLARKYPLHGHACVLNQTEYKEIMQDNGFDCDPYSFLVWSTFIHVNRWVGFNRSDHKVSLFFEAGYETQKRAGDLLKASLKDKRAGTLNRVVHAGFVKKEESEPAQAGDLVAWHVRRGYEHINKQKGFRPDTLALIEDRSIKTIHFNADRLRKIRADFEAKTGTLKRASQLIFSDSGAPKVGPLIGCGTRSRRGIAETERG